MRASEADEASNGAPLPGAAPVPPPRSRLRRLLRGGFALALSVVLLALLAVVFVHTPPGRAGARALLEIWGSRATGGLLRLGQLELRVWDGQAAVTALRLALPGATLDAQRIELDWSPRRGPSVRVLRPRLVVRDTGRAEPPPQEAAGLSAQPWRVLDELGRAELVDGRVELRSQKGEPWLVLGGVSLEMAEGPAGPIRLRVGDAAVGWPDGGPRLAALSAEATLRLDGGRLVIAQARIAGGSSSIELGGRLDRILPTSATATAHAALDGQLAGALVPGADLAGRIDADLALDVRRDRLAGTLTVASEGLRLAGTGPWASSGRGRIDGSELVIESLAARGPAGRLQASGRLALVASARTEVEVQVEGLDPAALARQLSGTELPLAVRASGWLRWGTAGWDREAARGEGRIALRAGDGPGLKPSGGATLRVRGLALAIDDAHVEARGARLTASLEVGAGKLARGRWTGELPLSALAALSADMGAALGVPGIEGRLLAEGEVSGPLSEPVVSARLRGEGLAVHGDRLALEAETRYQQGRLRVAPLVVRAGAGEATLGGSVPLRADGEWDLAGGIDALEMEPALGLVGLDGHGPATGTVRVTGRRDEPLGRVSVRTSVRLRRPEAGPEPAEDGVVVELEAASTGRRVQVERLQAELAGGRVLGKGSYDPGSGALEATLEADGLAWERLPLLPARARRLTGTLAGRLRLAGATTAPAGDLLLTLADPALDRAPLAPLSLEAHADGHELLVSGKAEAAFLRGAARFEGDWPLRLEIDAARLPLQALVDAYAPFRERAATLSASGTLAVAVDLRQPSRLRYSSSDLAASGQVRRLEWRVAPVSLSGDLDSVTLDGFRIDAAGASLAARGRVALAPKSPFDLQLEGDLDLQALDPALPGRRLGGSGTLRLEVKGSLEAPELSGVLRLAQVQGRFEGARWSDLDLDARFAGRELHVERLTANLLGGRVEARGSLPLVPMAGQAVATCAFALRDLDLAELLGREQREAAGSPRLLVSLEGEVEARALSLDALTGRGRLTRLDTQSVEGALALAEPAGWSLEAGRLELPPFRLVGPLGELEAQASAVVAGPQPRWSGALAGGVDLRVLSPFLPETTLGGKARIDARLVRANGAWQLEGGVKVSGARLSLDALDFAATELTGELRFEGDRVALEANGVSGDGRLRASGGMRLGPALLGAAEIRLDAERVPIQYPPGYRGRATGTLSLAGEPGRYRLTGAVSMSQGYYTAELDAKSQSLDRLDWQLAALEGDALTDAIALDVKVRLDEPLRIRNAKLRLDVEGTVAVAGTLAQPTAGGQVTLREGGELTLGRARLRVAQGRVELNGYPAGTPSVDFQAATRVGGVALEVQARGALDDLQLTLSSDRADLSQADLVTLLLTGRTAAAAASQSGVVVAEQLAVALGGMLQKGAGDTLLIDVSPDRSLLTDDTDPTQRFNIGTRVAQNLTVLYSAALDGTEKRWIVEFNPAGGRFRLRAITEEDNSLSLEATDRFSFDLWSRNRRGGAPAHEIERLVALRFEGSLPVPEPELRGAAGLKRRRRFSVLQRDEAADRVRKLLFERGYRAVVVDAESRPAPGGVELVLRVEAGPLVPIAWTGDDPGKRTRKAAERAWPAFATPDVAAALVARAALVRLQADGYYAASVKPEVDPGEGRVDVRLHVSRGPSGRGVDVALEGNRVLDDAALRAALPKPGSQAFFEALDPRSARISNDLRLAYAGVGYLRARVGTPRTAFDAASGRLKVTIPVRERGASLVAGVELPEQAARASDLGLRLKAGEPFDLAAYVADRDAVGAWYQAQGWIEARVRGVLEAHGGSVTVRYLADTGPRPRVADIRVEQAGHTRESLVRGSVTVREGDLVRPTALAESRERLSEIGVFRSVDVRAEPHPGDPGLRDVVVGLVDKPDVQLEYGLRYTTAGEGGAAGAAPSSPQGGSLQVAGAFGLSNPFGFGVKARVYGSATTNRQTWGVNLDAATLLGRRVRTQLFAFDDSDQDIQISGLASRVKGVSLQQTHVLLRDRRGRRWHDRLRLQWGYTFKKIEYVESAPNDLVLQGDRGFVSLGAIGDERDSLTDPKRGVFWTATTELARIALGSDADYVRLYGQLFAYLPLGPLVWAQGYRIGTVPGDDPLLLIENRFRAGGPTTVRGFEQNGLGPLTAEGDSLGGQAVAVLNQELRFPIWKSLQGGVFWDAGNVWLTASQLDLGGLRQSAGAGLRYIFPFGPIRIEYAWILGRKPGEPAGRFVFGLGHAF